MKIETLDFKAGPSESKPALTLNPGNITIFVGPNNGGKSTALREIAFAFLYSPEYAERVFSKVKLHAISDQKIDERIESMRVPSDNPRAPTNLAWGGERSEINIDFLSQQVREYVAFPESPNVNKQYVSNWFLRTFVLNLSGETRLRLADPTQVGDLTAKPFYALAVLFLDNTLRAKLVEIIHAAFRLYISINPTQFGQLSFALSELQIDAALDRSLSDEAITFFRATSPLIAASDGTRAFVGVISEILAGSADVLLIDEPEAFLHPGLAYQLGRQIALNVGNTKQLFAATHSPHFLMGCLSTGVGVDVVRLTHRAGAATARILPAARLKEMMTDPLLRSVNVVSALFYEGAVVVEGDSDRAFYQEINDRLVEYAARGDGLSHSTFLNAHNKQTAAEICVTLRQAGIPSLMILDIDWIKEDGAVAIKYFDAVGIPAGLRSGLTQTRRNVRGYLQAKDEKFKKQGGVSLLEGEELDTAMAFFDEMDSYGLFTVRHGEVESWLSGLGCSRNKSNWLPQMFEALGSDPAAESYVKPGDDDVWAFLKAAATWQNNPARRGMG